jgi:hypothetical protein
VTWRHVKALRCGVERRGLPFESTRAQIASSIGVVSSNRGAFRSPAAAQFWYEWRSSGLVLPILVGGALSIIAPWSWYVRDDAAGTLRLLMGAFAMPIVLAIPVGMAFAKPRFWSEDLSLPAFVAIRPLTDEAIIASKLKVAAASVAAAWLQVLAFVALWLSFWANLDGISRLAISWWAFHEQSVASVYAVSGLMVAAAMVLTWRCLVSRLWTGMSGSRLLFMGSVVSIGVVVSASMVLALDRLPEWILDDPARMGGVVWIMAALVSAKGWLAAYSWRMASPRHVREYLLAWSAATMGLLVLAIVLWQVVRIYVALDVYRFQAVVILLALLAVPLVRVGLAPSRVARNRHR